MSKENKDNDTIDRGNKFNKFDPYDPAFGCEKTSVLAHSFMPVFLMGIMFWGALFFLQ